MTVMLLLYLFINNSSKIRFFFDNPNCFMIIFHNADVRIGL